MPSRMSSVAICALVLPGVSGSFFLLTVGLYTTTLEAVDERDLVWVSDFTANAVLAFDPTTEKWTAYKGSGEGANVRQILGRPGEVYLPESGTNRIMVVRTGRAG